MNNLGGNTIYTIGHSNHKMEDFIKILKQHQITAVADVRSYPFSKYNNQFNQDALIESLKRENIVYVYLGKELGGRPEDPSFYENGVVNYEKVMQSDLFKKGIQRLLKGMEEHRIVILCAEKEPLDCHRTILISHYLQKQNINIKHILFNGALEDHKDTEKRILVITGLKRTLFDSNISDEHLIEEAFRIRAKEIAYREKMDKKQIREDDFNIKIPKIILFTIGFTHKSARVFFEILRKNKVKHIIDIRLNNESQLAGFTKKEDLKYFLHAIANIEYSHYPELAPTKEILTKYKKKEINWEEYSHLYLKLLDERNVENLIKRIDLDHACLLCSEEKPDYCHRRLLAEYIKSKIPDVEISHL